MLIQLKKLLSQTDVCKELLKIDYVENKTSDYVIMSKRNYAFDFPAIMCEIQKIIPTKYVDLFR